MLTLKHNYLTIYLFKETIIRNCLINEEVGVGVSFCLRKDEKFLVTAAGFEINTKSKNSFLREGKKKRIFHYGQPSFRPGIGIQS